LLNHNGTVDHLGSLWPRKLHHFGNLCRQKQTKPFVAINGSRNSHILSISGSETAPFWGFLVLGPEIAKMVQFLGPETVGNCANTSSNLPQLIMTLQYVGLWVKAGNASNLLHFVCFCGFY
jgi:hypothetical protein